MTRIDELRKSVTSRGLMADPQSFADMVRWSLSKARITYRQHGQHGELRRPMFHRFAVRGATDSVTSLVAQNVCKNNSLFAALSKRGR